MTTTNPSVRRQLSFRSAGSDAWSLIGIGIAVAGTIWVLLRLYVVVIPVVIAVLVTAMLSLAVKWLQSIGLPRVVAIWAVLLGLIGVVVGGVLWLAPSVVSEASTLKTSVSGGFSRIEDWLVTGPFAMSQTRVDTWSNSLRSQVGSFESQFAKGAVARTPLALEFIAGSVLSLVLTFFFLKDGAAIAARMPIESGRLENVWHAVSGYARALVVNATVNAVVIGVALALLGVPLAFPIAVVTFAASFVPVIGAIVAGTVAALVALVAVGFGTALAVVAVTVLIHHLEGYVVGPLVIGHHTGLHPIVLILALIVGITLGGIPGGFIAGPIASAIAGWAKRTPLARDKDDTDG